MTLIDNGTALDAARLAFRDELLDAGLLIGSASAGIYGRSATFEAILAGLDRVLTEMAAPLAATAVRFPPVYPRADFERTDYIASFPPLNNLPTQYRITVRGEQRWFAQCGFEATSATWLFPGEAVRVDAPCLDCGEPVTVEMRDGEITRVEPPGVVGHLAFGFGPSRGRPPYL